MFTADHLRFFLEVSRHGRLIEASRALGVDHTTVGRRITSLEKAAGRRLFDRTPAGWRLTEAGHRLVGYAETVESTLVAAFEDQTPNLTTLRHAHPDLNVELVTATEHKTIDTREFDIAVTLEEPSPRFVAFRRLATYSLHLYATREYLESSPAVTKMDDLRNHTLIWYVGALLDVAPLRIFDSILADGRAQIQTNNITGHWLAARSGLGIAPLPSYIGEPDDTLVRVVAEHFSIERTYWIAVPRELTGLARVKAVDELLSNVVAEHPHLTSGQ